MIFYDRTQLRKYFIRSGVGVFLMTLLGLAIILLVSLHTESTPFSEVSAHEDAAHDMQVALTFDDGPHPDYTLPILEILEEKEVPAAFFFIGKEMLEYPDVVRAVHKAGHEIGNHTFTHSPQVHQTKQRMRFELEATNHVIEQLTGERARFYRSPYLLDFAQADAEFITNTKLAPSHPLHWINDLGYVGVSAYIDPQDWDLQNTGTLFQRVVARTEHGSVILLHDGGVQRQVTIEALPYIIDELRAQGYTFVSLSELSGIPAYAPPAARINNSASNLSVSVLGTLYATLLQLFVVVTIIVLVLSIGRLCVIGAARMCPSPHKPTAYQGGATILIPAYNEASNIAATIASAAASTHEHVEIIVIDDGSTDATRATVLAAAAHTTTPIRYLYKENGGKASALNVGLAEATHDIVVAIDGDTIIHPDAVSHLTSHFNDLRVGAVAGRVSAITNGTWLSWFQDIEYTVSQNIEKMAFNTLFGSISVIPGAIGAWRKDAIIAAGGYSDDTQVEDQDLTLALHANRYRVIYDRCAVAYTEVPATVRSFLKQRFRWMFGTLQCLWKYKHYFGNFRKPQLGLVIVPYGILFAFLTPLLMPITDGLLLYALLTGSWHLPMIAALVFLLIDLLYHALGLLHEPRKLVYLPLVAVQRLFYRLALSLIMLKSIWYALEGTRAYWAAQLRTGTAQALFLRERAAHHS